MMACQWFILQQAWQRLYMATSTATTITPADAAIALQIAATGGWDPAADVDGDNRITSLDALMILQAATAAIEL